MGTFERRLREKQLRRRLILEAAKEVFFEKGLKAAKMDEVAERAELSKGTLYLYFQSKEELYLSLLDEGTRIFFEILEKNVNQKLSAPRRLTQVLIAYYEFYKNHNRFFEIMFFLQHGDIPQDKISSELFEICQKDADMTLRYVENILIDGIKSGVFREVDTWKSTLFSWSAMTGVLSILSEKKNHKFIGMVEENSIVDFTIGMIMESLLKK